MSKISNRRKNKRKKEGKLCKKRLSNKNCIPIPSKNQEDDNDNDNDNDNFIILDDTTPHEGVLVSGKKFTLLFLPDPFYIVENNDDFKIFREQEADHRDENNISDNEPWNILFTDGELAEILNLNKNGVSVTHLEGILKGVCNIKKVFRGRIAPNKTKLLSK